MATKSLVGLVTPDFVWDMSAGAWIDADEYHGIEGFEEFFAQWTKPYDHWEMEVEELTDAGEDRVLARLRQRGRLAGTDSWVVLDYVIVYTLAGGLLQRARVFPTGEAAREALKRE